MDEINLIDSVARSYEALPILKESIAYAFAFFDARDNKIYVLGGYGADSRPSNKIQVVYLTGVSFLDKGELLPDLLPFGNMRMGGVWIPERREAYLFGGIIDYNLRDSIVRFRPDQPEGNRADLMTNTLPQRMADFPVVWDSTRGLAYIFGGYKEWTEMDTIYAFDPTAPSGQRFQLLSDRLPTPRSLAGAARVPNEDAIYVIGGSPTYAQILKFSPNASPGNRITIMPEQIPTMYWGMHFAATYDPRNNAIFIYAADTYSARLLKFDLQGQPGSRLSEITTISPRWRGVAAAYLESTGMHAYLGGTMLGSVSRDITLFRW